MATATAFKLTLHALQKLTPLKKLDQKSLLQLTQQSKLIECPAGKQLQIEGDSQHHLLFLLDGEVLLNETDKKQTYLVSNTAAANHALASNPPRQLSLTTLSDIHLIDINKPLLEKIQRQEPAPPPLETIGVDTTLSGQADEAPDNPLFQALFQQYMCGQLETPSLPALAIRISNAVNNPTISLEQIAKLIQADPAITGHLLEIANSALNRGNVQVSSCLDAITRMGLNFTRDLVTSLAMRRLFKTKSAPLKKRMVALWHHSTQVAALSAVIAKQVPNLDPNRALLAGLTHDVGCLAILAFADANPELATKSAHLDHCLEKLRAPLGAMVLKKWNFDDDLIEVALESEQWQRDSQKSADYCDIVLVAQLHSYIGTSEMGKHPRLIDLPAFQKLSLGTLAPKKSLEMLNIAESELNQMKRLLNGN
ncbi:MAG: HDOD domain-containing protein [Gammaproteobacteria bacterium]|nr:HDOD domain-containing protein [Gammaproteobacteria bacterium]